MKSGRSTSLPGQCMLAAVAPAAARCKNRAGARTCGTWGQERTCCLQAGPSRYAAAVGGRLMGFRLS
jgi:hypothetical protein